MRDAIKGCLTYFRGHWSCAEQEKELTQMRRERDDAITMLRLINEETVLAGFPAGDRAQTLANVRSMSAARAARAYRAGHNKFNNLACLSGEELAPAVWKADDEWNRLTGMDKLDPNADWAEWIGNSILEYLRTRPSGNAPSPNPNEFPGQVPNLPSPNPVG